MSRTAEVPELRASTNVQQGEHTSITPKIGPAQEFVDNLFTNQELVQQTDSHAVTFTNGAQIVLISSQERPDQQPSKYWLRMPVLREGVFHSFRTTLLDKPSFREDKQDGERILVIHPSAEDAKKTGIHKVVFDATDGLINNKEPVVLHSTEKPQTIEPVDERELLTSGGQVFRAEDNPYRHGNQHNTRETVYPYGW